MSQWDDRVEATRRLVERLAEWDEVATSPDGACYVGCPGCGRFWDMFELIDKWPLGSFAAGGMPCRCNRAAVRFADLVGDWTDPDTEGEPYGL